ncbi:3-oxoacyl-[acyl-carrier-protein] reductase FabG-like [Ixodes scapularis]|uniref:3-oxoacyl-[acyl-carrier-protein] reductase FabG-like n=1 Tax=Ixodes scapularis TaxID=6945 RepID=UPI001A9E74EE|nr:3-oxoacyl-[acyl-carrier-protein] reductase FabG-like [Ixodes scapularis]
MLRIRQYVFWLVLCCIITGRASSDGDSSGTLPSESLPESENEKSETSKKSEYDSGTSSLELQGRLALVTGGASGIGRSVAMVLARENVTVIVADINKTRGDETIVYLKLLSSHLRHKAIHVDVRNSTLVEFLIQCIELEYPNMTISIVVNSAGILHEITPVVSLTDETFNNVISTNLKGTFLVTKEAVKHMLSRNVTGGAIVNIASILGKGGFPGLSAYTASKGGVIAFTKAIAVELATRGIRVNAILPGLTNTPMIQKYGNDTIRDRLRSMIPVQRIAEPLEISETIVFMCSTKTSYMTGSTVDVAGGTQL